MNIRNIKENEFDGTINISSNIKDNKNTIIGKFDLRDLLFILVAGVVGIIALSILIAVFAIKSIFIVFIVLAIIEIPIITLGFLKLYNIPAIDYIKMKTKSDNSVYRKQVHRIKKDKNDKYLMIFAVEYNIEKLEEIINKLHNFISFKNVELKIMFKMIYLIIDVREDFDIDYSEFFDYLRVNKDILYISNIDITNYEIYINSLKFLNKNYTKKQLKDIKRIREKIIKLKLLEEGNERYDYLTNRVIESKDKEYIKVYKFILYESPFDLSLFNELKDICQITIHTNVVIDKETNSIQLSNLNYINTFIYIIGSDTDFAMADTDFAMADTDFVGANTAFVGANTAFVGADIIRPNGYDKKVKEILNKYQILYKEIKEEKVKDSLLFLMENKY